MVCRNICKKIYSEIVTSESRYSVGKRYCRRCDVSLSLTKNFVNAVGCS
jgi:hypothetical protein